MSAMLVALLLAGLGKARAAAQRMVCLSNPQQFNFALNNYVADSDGFFPLAASHLAFQNEERFDRLWMDYLDFYLGISDIWGLDAIGRFSGYAISPGPY